MSVASFLKYVKYLLVHCYSHFAYENISLNATSALDWIDRLENRVASASSVERGVDLRLHFTTMRDRSKFMFADSEDTLAAPHCELHKPHLDDHRVSTSVYRLAAICYLRI
jgi:hypothetical protein